VEGAVQTETSPQSQAELYRRKAREAEARAQEAMIDSLKVSWLSIARCYRQMAEQQSYRH
jgi:hypothetical protein